MPLACSAATLRVSGLEHEQSYCEHEAQCSSIIPIRGLNSVHGVCMLTVPLHRHMILWQAMCRERLAQTGGVVTGLR